MRAHTAIALLPLIVLAFGCQAEPEVTDVDLEPAETVEQTGVIEGAATTTVRGLEVTVQTEPWGGDPAVLEAATPLWIKVANTGDTPVRIHYPDFAVLGAAERYRAVPPARVDIATGTPVVAGDWTPERETQLEATAFSITPYWDPIYAGADVVEGAWEVDTAYFEEYGGFWRDAALGPAQMLENAIPEGVLHPDGVVMGFMFFEQVDPTEEQVNLVVEFDDAASGGTYATVMLPFDVD